MRRPSILLSTIAVVFSLVPSTAGAAPDLQPVIVVLDPAGGPPAAVLDDTVSRFGGRPGYVYQTAIQGFSAGLPPAAIAALGNNPNVVSVTPDQEVSIAAQETPTGYDRTEADLVGRSGVPLDTTGCPAGGTCTDVDIAVLDTGVAAHTDLNVVARTDCSLVSPFGGTCQEGSGADGHGHGTHVAGTAAAFDNGIGGVGMAPGARIHSVKVLGDDGTGLLSGIIAGVDWVAARAGVIDVVNMSLAGVFSDPGFDAAISNTVAQGVVFAVAAGNSSADASSYSPASHADVITVSALADADGGAGGLSQFRCRKDQTDDTFATFSNFGPPVDIAAPGVCILSTWNDGGYHTISGTSMATPHVAGAAALYYALHGRDVTGDTVVDGADATAVKDDLLADAHPQVSPCGFTGDPDGLPEPLLFVNGPAFGGTGVCEQEAVDASPPSAPGSFTATADGYPVDLEWTTAVEPESALLEYRVYRDGLLLATVGYDQTGYRDAATAPATTYSYEVEAVNLQGGVGPRSGPVPATTSSDDPTDAGWWALDDGGGSVAADSSAWRRSGALMGGPVWAVGKVGGGLDLDGADDRLDLAATALDGVADLSVGIWIKTTKTGEQALVSGANPGNDNEFLLLLANPTTLRYFVGYNATAGVEWTMESVADGQWHHLALVRNEANNTVWAWRDGVSLGGWGLGVDMTALEVDALVVGQEQDTVGGGFQAAQAVDGVVDEVRIYTRVLTQSDIDVISLRDQTPPTGPDTLDAWVSGHAVDLEWSAAGDAESGIETYEIRRDDGAGGPTALLTEVPGTQTSWRDPTARPSASYVYEVVARNGGGLSGPPSPSAAVVTAVADPDLLGWWALDDGAGTSVADWSAHGRAGLVGGPVWSQGRFVGGLAFDGTDDLVSLDHTVLDGVDEMTASLWFRTTKTGIQAFVTGANTVNQAEYTLVAFNSTQIRFYTGANNDNHVWWTVPSIADGEWHHLAAVRDPVNDRAILYLDGVDYGPKAAQPGELQPMDLEAGGLILGQEQDSLGGGFDPAQAFVGTIDDIRFYSGVLTADEIRDLAGLGLAQLDVEPPAAPTGLGATPGIGEVSLDWADNVEADLESYRVYRAADGGASALLVADLVASDHVDTTVVAGSSYEYTVTAVDTAGNESVASALVSASPLLPEVTVAATDAEAAEAGSDPGALTVSRTGPTADALTVTYAVSGSATAGDDYSALSGSVVIPAGSASASLDVVPVDDSEVEDPETVVVTLTAGAEYTVGSPSSGAVTITSDDAPDSTPPAAPTGLTATADFGQIALDWADNVEPDVASYTVARAEGVGGSYADLAVGLTSSDFVDTTVVDGVTYFYVVTAWDTAGNESAASGEVSASPLLPEVTVVATDAEAAEAGSDPGVVTVSRTGPTADPLTVTYAVSGSATAGDDYSALSGSVVIPAGSASASVDVVPVDDSEVEDPETVVVTLTAASGYVIGTGSEATVTIADDDEAATVVDVVASSEITLQGSLVSGGLAAVSVDDGGYEVLAEHHTGGRPSQRVSVLDHRWTFQIGSPDLAAIVFDAHRPANADGDDFALEWSSDGSSFTQFAVVATSVDGGPQVFDLPVGVSGTIVVRAVDTDRTPGNYSLDELRVDQLVIRTTTGGPMPVSVTITASDPDASESGDRGSVTVTRSDSSGALTVDLDVSGSATNGGDYDPIAPTAVFADGVSSVVVTVTPIDDLAGEGPEDVVVTLVAGTGYLVGMPSSASVVIADDDGPPTVDQYAVSQSTSYGSAGGLGGTLASDDSYQTLTEESWGGGKRSRLEHTWTFQVAAGSAVSLHVEAHGSGGSDDFVFAYSLDGSTWFDLVVVTKTGDDDSVQVAALPSSVSGTVLIRVSDTDRSRDDPQVTTLSLDHLLIRTN